MNNNIVVMLTWLRFTFLLVIFLLISSVSHVYADSSWQKYISNPVIDLGSTNSYFATNPTVLKVNNEYKMWFDGFNSINRGIMYATSSDSMKWVQPLPNFIINLPEDIGNASQSSVVFNQNKYKMWYLSTDSISGRQVIKYSQSDDGVNWESPIIVLNQSQDWESNGIAHPQVLMAGNEYKLFYNGNSHSSWRTGYATSKDGIQWTKYPNNPVFSPDSNDFLTVGGPSVLYESGKYHMYYHSNHPPINIRHAMSTDGINWTRDYDPAITVSANSFDSYEIAAPSVIRDGNLYKMWYGGNNGRNWKIGYATRSADLILDVPDLKQTAEPWQGDTYDSADRWNPANATINRWGCALTSAAMILNFHGINLLPDKTALDPGSLNTWLNDQEDGYVGDGYINWLAVSRLSRLARDTNNITGFEALEYQRIRTQDDTQLIEDLNNSRPDILQEPGHFIVAKGIGDNTFYINDPYYDRTDLNSYNNTYLSLGRYVPSNTNLSYIMLTTNPEIQIAATNEEKKFIGSQFVEEPLTIDGINNNMKPLKTFYIQKPKSGIYKIWLSATKTQIQEVKIYLYDTQGNVNIITQNIAVGINNPEFIEINFDPENIDNSFLEKIVTFQSTIKDIKEGQSLKLINKAVANNLVSIITNSEKDYKKGKKNSVLLRLKSFETLLNSTKGKGIDEKVYQILYYDISYLKTHL